MLVSLYTVVEVLFMVFMAWHVFRTERYLDEVDERLDDLEERENNAREA